MRATSGTSNGAATVVFVAEPGWEFWWELNRDLLLDQLVPVDDLRPRSGRGPPLTGRGRRGASLELPVRDARLTKVLATVLRTERHRLMCNTSVLALARVAQPRAVPDRYADIVAQLSHDDLSVRTAATLALGVLGAPRSVPLLAALASDSAAGRRAVSNDHVSWQVRAHAAIALGVLGQAVTVDLLESLVTDTPTAQRDLRAGAVVALGLVTESGRPRAVRSLLRLLDRDEPDQVVAAQVPTALAKHGDPGTLVPLLARLRHPKTHPLVRQSCAIALGRLAEARQLSVLETLFELVQDEADAATRHFAIMGLGRMAARATTADAAPILSHLADAVSRPVHRADRSWAALAAALGARSHSAWRSRMTQTLAEAYRREHDPSFKAAHAIALALLDATGQAPALLADLEDVKDAGFRGYVAVALGLLRTQAAATSLLEMATDQGTDPQLRLQVVRALGYLRSPGVAQVLLQALERSGSTQESWSIARALGRLDDPGAVDGLISLVEDRSGQTVSRAYACEALGLLGEKTPARFNARIAEDLNYRARVTTLEEIIGL